MRIPQEEDRFGVKKYVLALLGSVAVCVACGLLCERLVFDGHDPVRPESGGIYTGLMNTERDALRRRARDEGRLESWGPVTSTTVHMPIDRAFELSLPRLVVARPDDVGVEEHLGATVPLDAAFVDTLGARVRLGGVCDGTRPVLLVLAYEKCPMLCGLVLRGAAKAVKELGWKPGDRFRAVTVSFDPEEGRTSAHSKQLALLDAVGCAGEEARWPFLAGTEREIQSVTTAVGFRSYRDPVSKDIAHPAILVVLTPDGRISRYLYGVDFRAKDLELALLEAGEGKTGSTLERVLLRCYRWDATTHRYQLAVLGVMRATGAVVGVFVLALVGSLLRRERRA